MAKATTKTYKALRSHSLTVTRTRRDKEGHLVSRPSINFDGGYYRTANKEIQDYLDNNARNGKEYREVKPEAKQEEAPPPELTKVDQVTQINEALDFLKEKKVDTAGVDTKAKIHEAGKKNGFEFPNLK